MARVIGIETSCDETGVAIYDSEAGLLSNCLYSQIDLHKDYGGVVPELASRDHVRKISYLVQNALTEAKTTKEQIDAVAYTNEPGLNGALLVGAGVANGFAYSLHIPTIPIHHLEGHLLSPMILVPELKPPFIALLVSGGHTQIIAVEEIGKYAILGDTLDDAAGEAFDKTAKMLGLPYPGGKYIAELAINGQNIYQLPRPMLNSDDLDMSFSGLKTAARILINKIATENNGNLTLNDQQNIAYAVEEAITDVLIKKSLAAMKKLNINTLVVSGGVSANLKLRQKLNDAAGINVYYPPLELCTDNGAMIAFAGFMRFSQAKHTYSFSVKARSELCSYLPR